MLSQTYFYWWMATTLPGLRVHGVQVQERLEVSVSMCSKSELAKVFAMEEVAQKRKEETEEATRLCADAESGRPICQRPRRLAS